VDRDHPARPPEDYTLVGLVDFGNGCALPGFAGVYTRIADPAITMVARDATSRFSILGMIVVGTILVTGMVNTYMLAGSAAALTTTHYGHLLLLKIGLFLAMVGVAAFNRLRLVPRLSSAYAVNDASRLLQRNSLIEATMGLLILVIVGVLGTLPPAIHAVDSAHMHAN